MAAHNTQTSPASPISTGAQQPQRWYIIVILGALSAFAPLSIDMYLPGLPSLTRDFQTGTSLIQLTLSACLIGLALGQVIAGPISDMYGRRRPLLVGLILYVLASLICSLAPSVPLLIALRFIQGLAGAAGIVIARAIVRDLYSGIAIARIFSLLMLVSGLAPILAPVIGGLILQFTSWRGTFLVLAILGALILAATFFGLPETLPASQRQTGGLRTTLKIFAQLLTERSFVGYALASGLAMAAMFAYISGSPFVLQEVYGLSPQVFSLCFGLNALGIMLAGQMNGRLVGRFSPLRLLVSGLTSITIGGILLLLAALLNIGLPGILPTLFVVVASIGFIIPNSTSLALSGHPSTAGSRSALIGVFQYLIGATAAPLVGLSNAHSALPMAIVIAALTISALTVFFVLYRPEKPA